jgi:Tfp pilus assembly protein PilO
MALPQIQSVIAYISHLSKRERMIAYAVIVFISVAAMDRLIISPIFSKMKSLEGAISEKEANIKKSARIVSQKDRIAAESAKYSSFLTSALSEEEEMVSLLKELERIANASSVYLLDMKPVNVQNMGSFKKYAITLNCESQMEQLVDFMYNIENSKKMLTIEKLQIGPKAKKSSIAKCGMTIYRVVNL